MHAPGVVCIVHGLRRRWPAQDNGKLVVITSKLWRSRYQGQLWQVRPYISGDLLHGFHPLDSVPVLTTKIQAPQRNLIPLGPERDFAQPKELYTMAEDNDEKTEYVPYVEGGLNIRVYTMQGEGAFADSVLLTMQVYPLPADDAILSKITSCMREALQKKLAEIGLTEDACIDAKDFMPPPSNVQ